jgi:hypothetical protein
MLTDPSPGPPRSGMNLYVVIPIVVFLLAALYVGGVFYSRERSTRQIEAKSADAERTHDENVYQAMGGDRFDILKFFAYPGIVNRGDSATLCYSVSNAKSVTLEPQSNAVWPAFERCVSVTPAKTTTYTLTATDAAGNKKTATAEVEVH